MLLISKGFFRGYLSNAKKVGSFGLLKQLLKMAKKVG